MRVTYVSGAAVPSLTANSIQIMKMCQAMVQEGHKVTLVAPKWRAYRFKRSDILWDHYGIKTRFPIKWINGTGRLGNYFYALAAVLLCRWHMKADMIFARHLPSACLSSLIGFPVIFECHSIPYGTAGRRLFRLMLTGKGLKRVVVISRVLERMILDSFPNVLSPDKVLVAPDGVDLESFEYLPKKKDARIRLGLDSDKKIIAGYVGHLYAGRGIDLIIKLAERSPNIKFLIVGGHPEDVSICVQEIQNAGILNVVFAGFIQNSLIPLYYAACDMLLMPYQRSVAVSGGGDTSQWMSPMKMFEYMASGRLILASDLPVLREILNERNAVLIEPEDVDGWHNTLSRLEAGMDDDWVKKISLQAQKDVALYTWRRRVSKCLTGVMENHD